MLFLLVILWAQAIKRAGADVGLMFIAYNPRRVMTILTGDELREYLRIQLKMLSGPFKPIRSKISQFIRLLFPDWIFGILNNLTLVQA